MTTRPAAGALAAAALAAAACGSSTRGPVTPPEAGPWTWVASAGGPWRLPTYGSDIEIAPGDTHAVVMSGGTQLVAIALATGEVGPLTTVVTERGARIERLVRVGDRLIGFGVDDAGSAAWTIGVAPPTATRIELPDRAPEADADAGGRSWAAAVVSPDGSRVLVCTARKRPVVRDATTLATIVVVEAAVPCKDPVFTDNTHLVYRGVESQGVDLATNASVPMARGTITYGGPGGRTLAVSEHAKWRITDPGAGTMVDVRGGGIPRWLPDGKGVVGAGLGTLRVQPVTGGDARVIALPVDEMATRMAITSDAATAVVLAEQTLLAVDLATGRVRTPEGNVGRPLQVAPRDGAVIVAAGDRIRSWRDGKLEANGEARVVGFTAEPLTEPVATISGTTVSVWEPSTGDRRVIHELAEVGYVVERLGDRIVFDDGGALWRSKRGGPASRWFRFRDDLMMAGIDAANGRIAWYQDDVFFVADINRGDVWTLCSIGMSVRWDPSAPRIALEDGVGVEVYDLAARAAVTRVELDDLGIASTFVGATGELAIAGNERLLLWTPGASTALAWPTGPFRTPVAIGADARGAELAVAYADGAVLWVTVAGLRAHATSTAVSVASPEPPTCTLPRHATLDDLTLVPDDEPAPDPTDPECDDANDNPDDDCSVIYGTPDS